MPLMEWNAQLSVGVGQFDREHQTMVDMINALFDAVQAGRGREMLGRTLDGLLDYTKTHMIKEEQILEKHGFPGVDSHREEHRAVGRQIGEIRQRYDAGATGPMCMEVLTLMKKWLIEHIQGTDKQYQAFLNAKGLH